MTKLQLLATISCVIAISVGQILFKKTGMVINENGSLFSYEAIKFFLLAMVLYGLTTIAWILVLSVVPLNKAHAFMALSFIFVAIGSNIFFGEIINVKLFIGLGIILFGLYIVQSSY